MLLFDEKNDTFSDLDNGILPGLSDNSQIHYDYHGCLPNDDDSADHYRIPKRKFNVHY